MTTVPGPDISSKPARSTPRGGIRRKLLRSHLTIGLIAVTILVSGFGTSLWIRNNTLRTLQQGPTADDSTRILAGVQQSGTALQEWILLGDPEAKRRRADTWLNEIDPLLKQLVQRGKTRTTAGDQNRLTELTEVLGELRTWQWAIEDVAQTPGNQPARVSYLQVVQPVIDLVTGGSAAMLRLGASAPDGDRASLGLLSDLRHVLTETETALQIFLDTGNTNDEQRYRTYLDQALSIMAAIRDRQSTLTTDQQDLLEWLDAELLAFPSLVDTVISERREPRANLARHWLANELRPREQLTTALLESISTDQTALMQHEVTRVMSLHNAIMAFSLLLLVATICTIWIVSKQTADQLTRPIAALATATNELADGQLTHDLPVTSSDELGALTQSFNTMRAALDTTTDEPGFSPERESYLDRPRRHPSTVTAVDSAPKHSASQDHTDNKELGTLDWQRALDSVNGDREKLKQTIDRYLKICPQLREDLRTAIAEGDAAVVRHAAQAIRSSLDCFGVARAAALAYRLEEAGRRGWLESAAEQCIVLEEELDSIEPELQAFLAS